VTDYSIYSYCTTKLIFKVTNLLLSLYLSQLYFIFKFTILLERIMSS
jgi:hypothetical protein